MNRIGPRPAYAMAVLTGESSGSCSGRCRLASVRQSSERPQRGWELGPQDARCRSTPPDNSPAIALSLIYING